MESDRKRTMKPNFHTALTKRLWIFLILGVITIILGLVNVGIYFNILAITTSTEHTEILPGYIISLVSLVAGSFVVILFWRRPSFLVVFTLFICLGTICFCVVSAILTVTSILQPILSFSVCSYLAEKSLCLCSSVDSRQNLNNQFLVDSTDVVTFVRTSSCSSIQGTLTTLLYCQCGVYLGVFTILTVASVIAYLVLRLERARARAEEPYEEIFTISGGSSVSDSDEESHIDPTLQNGNSKSLSSATTPLSPRKLSTNSGHKTCPPGILKNSEKTEMQRVDLLPRSKSTDSIDRIYKDSNETVEKDSSLKGKSKLKEHRRRDKRAVTLHNLDTKQLQLILDLKLRYLEETRILKSQGDITQLQAPLHPVDLRRAMTPQPYRKKSQLNTIPKIIRSHTPQPGQVATDQTFSGSFMNQPMSPYIVPEQNRTQYVQEMNISEGSSIQSVPNVVHSEEVNFVPRLKSRPSVQQYFLPPEPIHRSKSAIPFREPLHRESAQRTLLPPQPITRQIHHIHDLPPEPIHRDGSAFQIVGRPNHKELGPMYSRGAISQDAVHRTPGEMIFERAIRDNFKLYANPFILKRNENNQIVRPFQHISTARSLVSEPPPPYAPPPTYQHFVALSNDEQSTFSQDENIYEPYEPSKDQVHYLRMTSPFSKIGVYPKQTTSSMTSDPVYSRRKESIESSIPESEDDVFVGESLRSRLSRTPQSINSDSSIMSHSDPPKHADSMQEPFIPVYRDSDRRRKPKKRVEKSKKVSDKENKPMVHKSSKPGDICTRDQPHEMNDLNKSESVRSAKERLSSTDTLDNTDSSIDHVYAISAKHRHRERETPATPDKVARSEPRSPRHVPSQNGVYEDIDDFRYASNDVSSQSLSSQASLISSSDALIDYTKAIDEIHPGLSDPRVLETMI